VAAADLAAGPDTPRTSPDFQGVMVAAVAPREPRGPVDLVGVFQLPASEAEAIDAYPHRGLVVVLTSAEGAVVATPFRLRIFFEDDVQLKGSVVKGFFRVPLVPADKSIPPGTHWVSVSLGLRLSNTAAFAGPAEEETA
jgi:hypothetical protein